jgi:hypothetical protein
MTQHPPARTIMSTPVLITLARWIGYFALFQLVVGIIAIRFVAKTALPIGSAADVAGIDRRWLDAMRPFVDQLAELGFVLRTYVDGIVPATAPHGVRCVAFLANETTGDMAQVMAVERPVRGKPAEVATPALIVRCVGSRRVVTSNNDTPSIFVRPPAHAVNVLPMLLDMAMLRRAHDAICARHLGTARGEPFAWGTEVRELNRESAAEMVYQVEQGRMQPTSAGTYVPTWIGAVHGFLLLHPYLIQWQKRRMRDRAERLLAELGLSDGPPDMPHARPHAA